MTTKIERKQAEVRSKMLEHRQPAMRMKPGRMDEEQRRPRSAESIGRNPNAVDRNELGLDDNTRPDRAHVAEARGVGRRSHPPSPLLARRRRRARSEMGRARLADRLTSRHPLWGMGGRARPVSERATVYRRASRGDGGWDRRPAPRASATDRESTQEIKIERATRSARRREPAHRAGACGDGRTRHRPGAWRR